MVVQWSTSPALPSGFVDGVVIEEARFALETLRVVGDAGPGDPRTTATSVVLDFNWDQDTPPPEIPFDDAPLGLYSQVALAFDGAIATDYESYEIRGTVEVNSQQYEFRIEDANPLTFNVAIDRMVSPGQVAIVHLRINLQHALDALEWSTLDRSDGRIELEEGDSQMSVFRSKLIESFEIVDVSMRPLR